ncbi:unnamed protein product [Prunus armeniaca]
MLVEDEPRRDSGKRQVEGELVISSYQEAVKWMLEVDVVEGLFTKEMGYSGMTLSTLEDQMKATMKLFIAAHNVIVHPS